MKKIIFKVYQWLAANLAGHHLGSFYPLGVISNFVLSLCRDKNAPLIINGHQMFLDKNDSLRLSVHTHEPLEVEIIKQEVGGGDMVLDIGAHIGYFTLIFAHLVGEQGKVFAFEPHPESFALLQKNIEVNHYRNVILVNKGLGAEQSKRKFYAHILGSGYSLYGDERQPFLEIETVKGDDYLRDKVDRVDFIKIDIEGAEPEALAGLEQILKKSPKLKMLIEFYPKMLKKGQVEPINFLKQLVNYGFKLYCLKDNKKQLATPEQIIKICPFSRATNLFGEK